MCVGGKDPNTVCQQEAVKFMFSQSIDQFVSFAIPVPVTPECLNSLLGFSVPSDLESSL